MSIRRLPVYLLLDCSGSMSGEPIEAVRQGVRALLSDLKSDPTALETAFLSVMTFADRAEQLCPLTELIHFREPTLGANGSTALGEALTLLDARMDAEVVRKTADQKGDYRPMVFLMTDGVPTDDWEGPAERVKKRKTGNVIACAAGPGANVETLKQITENVVVLDNLQPDTLRAYFKWVSDSIKVISQSVAVGGEGKPTPVPPPPAQIHIIP
jgi:uncharacterized protein YegL